MRRAGTPSESQKARALWKMKAGQRQGGGCYDPERKDNLLGRNKPRLDLGGRAPQRPDCGTGQILEVRGELVLSWIFWLETCCGSGLQWAVAERAQAWFHSGKLFGPVWICGTALRLHTASTIGTFQGSMGRMVSSSSSFLFFSRNSQGLCLDRSAWWTEENVLRSDRAFCS